MIILQQCLYPVFDNYTILILDVNILENIVSDIRKSMFFCNLSVSLELVQNKKLKTLTEKKILK